MESALKTQTQPATEEVKPPKAAPWLRGVKHWNAKLTPELVREIRAAEGEVRIIGITYGISGKSVCNIKNRKSWGWLQ